MLKLKVNGKTKAFKGPPFKRLIDVLREDFGLTGTKEGCGEGECGACTVLLDGEPVNSCLIPVCQAAGSAVETVEALGRSGRLHPLQKGFLEEGGAQCGICTPGMLMSALAWRRAKAQGGAAGVRQAIAGNLCRCTGYEDIVQAVLRTVKGGGRRARR